MPSPTQKAFETTFSSYVATAKIGEGGAGFVYSAVDQDNNPVAIKVLKGDGITTDRRKRFKNEINFLSKNNHLNIVRVLDHGLTNDDKGAHPFYVMPLYESSLSRHIARGIQPQEAIIFFSQMLDGVEAAHLKGVIHRDLKPENILFDAINKSLAVADFGIARFLVDQLTAVETKAQQRMANFHYAAPEQKIRGGEVGVTADIYALGLILNEMFTKVVPQGTSYRLIGQVSDEYSYLDSIVAEMLHQDPQHRPKSIDAVKQLMQKSAFSIASRQKISAIDKTVIKEGEIDDSLALQPLRITNVSWDKNSLQFTFDRPVHSKWINALQNMGNYSAVMGKGPESFHFNGDKATVSAQENEAQAIIDHFKTWLPTATQVLKRRLESEIARKTADQQAALAQERQLEEQRLRMNNSLKF